MSGYKLIAIHAHEMLHTYESYTTVVELLASISEILKENILSSFQATKYYSIMADESTDSASQEELSVCARWLHEGKVVG